MCIPEIECAVVTSILTFKLERNANYGIVHMHAHKHTHTHTYTHTAFSQLLP